MTNSTPSPAAVAALVAEMRDESCTSERCSYRSCHLFRESADALEAMAQRVAAVQTVCDNIALGYPGTYDAEGVIAEISAAITDSQPARSKP